MSYMFCFFSTNCNGWRWYFYFFSWECSRYYYCITLHTCSYIPGVPGTKFQYVALFLPSDDTCGGKIRGSTWIIHSSCHAFPTTTKKKKRKGKRMYCCVCIIRSYFCCMQTTTAVYIDRSNYLASIRLPYSLLYNRYRLLRHGAENNEMPLELV